MNMLKKTFSLSLIAAMTVAFLIVTHGGSFESTKQDATPIFARQPTGPVLVIDAGHGGADGGAQSESGTRESEINLDIALRLDSLMGFFGECAVMTRDSEMLSYSKAADTIRAKKVEDQKNRLHLINSAENAVLISIHQNKYTTPGPFGAQVFFARTQGSAALAESMQSLLTDTLNRQSRRAAVKIPDGIYLMDNIACPGILIECGFLSNPNEEALLKTDEYRLKVAAVIAAGYINARHAG